MSSTLSSLLLNASVSMPGWSDADAIRTALRQALVDYDANNLEGTSQQLALAAQLVDRKQADELAYLISPHTGRTGDGDR